MPMFRSLVFCAAALLSLNGIAAPADPWNARARELFRQVIAMPTSAGLGKVPAMAELLAGELRAGGFPSEDVHVLPLGESASLIVRYRGDGTGGKPIGLMAHMDVVTAKREDWQRDPYTLIEQNGEFYGRGTQDVKGGVVSIVMAFLRLKAEGFKPTRDLIVILTGDEETTGHTAKDLLTNHRALVDAEYVLNSDAGGGTLDEASGKALLYKLQTAEKTFASFDITLRNPGGHSSRPRPDNAIYQLADLLQRIQAAPFPPMASDTTRAYLQAMGQRTPGALGAAMRRFADNPQDKAAGDVLGANSSYIGTTRTTCVPTMLRGGHADNALPQSATVTINCRIFPGVAIKTVQARLQQLSGPAAEIKPLDDYAWSDASPLRTDIVAAVTRVVRTLHPGLAVIPIQDSGASDGVFFRGAGIPTYGVSEVFHKESEDFAHGLDERLPVKSFYDGLRFWTMLITELSAHVGKAD